MKTTLRQYTTIFANKNEAATARKIARAIGEVSLVKSRPAGFVFTFYAGSDDLARKITSVSLATYEASTGRALAY